MSDHGLSEYKRIMTEILLLMKKWLPVPNPDMGQIEKDFIRIEQSAPPDLKRYAGAMVAMHVDELERRWRK